jgi:transposase InsO family protein
VERQRILSVANSREFGHLPPSQIVPRLADRGIYLASKSTMYRVLREAGQLAHRRRGRRNTSRGKPRAFTAPAPNQVYSWDITYLPTAIKGQYLYLYLFLDLFSRKIVGWQVFESESSAHAADLLRDICRREGVIHNQVVLHSDNGGPHERGHHAGDTSRAERGAVLMYVQSDKEFDIVIHGSSPNGLQLARPAACGSELSQEHPIHDTGDGPLPSNERPLCLD